MKAMKIYDGIALPLRYAVTLHHYRKFDMGPRYIILSYIAVHDNTPIVNVLTSMEIYSTFFFSASLLNRGQLFHCLLCNLKSSAISAFQWLSWNCCCFFQPELCPPPKVRVGAGWERGLGDSFQ